MWASAREPEDWQVAKGVREGVRRAREGARVGRKLPDEGNATRRRGTREREVKMKAMGQKEKLRKEVEWKYERKGGRMIWRER